MPDSLEGKVVLITGGGVRVGRAIALAVGRAGAHVAVHYRGSREGAEQVAQILGKEGRRARTFGADLTQGAAIEPLVSSIEAELGPISALVNSAARFDRAPFLDTPAQLLEDQWALNARAPYLLTQAVARRMVGRGGGDVVNVLDIGGVWQAWRHYSAYCMSKAAMAALTRCLALELAPAVRVNGVAPGTVLPPEGMAPQALEALRARIPQQRFGSPEDIAEAVLFFLTGPRFVTGQILAVDGGRSIGAANLEG